MKKSFVKTVATLGIGMVIGSATLASAAPSTVQAVLTKFSFSVNGQEQKLESDPLVYNGKTYLPVREVAEITGYKLNYDNKSKSIKLESKEDTVVNDNTTTTPKPASTPAKNGETIDVGDFKIKVNSVTYEKEFSGFVAGKDEEFAVINFDVFITKEPVYELNWTPVRFIETFKLDSGKELRGSSFTTDKIKTNEWSNVNVVMTVNEGSKVSEVYISDPVQKKVTDYKVSF